MVSGHGDRTWSQDTGMVSGCESGLMKCSGEDMHTRGILNDGTWGTGCLPEENTPETRGSQGPGALAQGQALPLGKSLRESDPCWWLGPAVLPDSSAWCVPGLGLNLLLWLRRRGGPPPVPSQARAEQPHVPQVLPVLGVALVSHVLHEWDLTQPSKALGAHMCMHDPVHGGCVCLCVRVLMCL